MPHSDESLGKDDRIFLDALSEPVLLTDSKRFVRYVNPGFLTSFGYQAADVIGRDFAELVSPNDRDLFLHMFDCLNAQDLQCKSELELIDANAQDRFIELHLIADHENDSFRFLITERPSDRFLDEKVREKMLHMLENIPDGFFSVDKNWRLIYLNRQAEKISQKPREKLIGKHLWDEYPEMVGTYVHSKYLEAMRTGRHQRFEGYLPQFDAWFETNLFPSSEGLTIYFRDVTEAKKQRDDLKLYAERLKQSNEELEQFAHIASHDLKEPLRMVSSFVHLLKQEYSGKLDEEADEFLHYISDGSSRMQQMISDLLLYSRSTRAMDKKELVDMNDILAKAVEALSVEVKKRSAEIQIENLPRVEGNAEQLIFLFQHLLSNSLKFVEAGVAPKIKVSSFEENSNRILVVSDNGIGLDPQYAKKVFQIFQKLHARDRFAGSGIGLAIAKKIVDRHGGEIWFESKKDMGSRFYVSLPPSEEEEKTGADLLRKP